MVGGKVTREAQRNYVIEGRLKKVQEQNMEINFIIEWQGYLIVISMWVLKD